MESTYNANFGRHVTDHTLRTVEAVLENGWYSVWKKNLRVDTFAHSASLKEKDEVAKPTSPCSKPSKLCDMV